MELEYEREEEDYPELEPKYTQGVPGCQFSFKDGFIVSSTADKENIEYKTVVTVFRREYPFGYPGTNGQRKIVHKWKIRSGDTYYRYNICRYCYDIRVQVAKHPYQDVVQTGICPPCRVDSLVSKHYWDNIYSALCTCPLLGYRFEHCIKWKLARVGYNNRVSRLGQVLQRDDIQKKVRDNSMVEPATGEKEDNTDSDSIQDV